MNEVYKRPGIALLLLALLAALVLIAVVRQPMIWRMLVMSCGTKTEAVVTRLEDDRVTVNYEYAKHKTAYATLDRGEDGPHMELYKQTPIRYLRLFPDYPILEDDGGASREETKYGLKEALVTVIIGVLALLMTRRRIWTHGLGALSRVELVLYLLLISGSAVFAFLGLD